ncbi:MAG TPA: thiamine-phosphate kinase [Thermoanaerobaculia bacterium]|nr:thiamine-phosphate kinase [Thermoanaerobaculia bacterium]
MKAEDRFVESLRAGLAGARRLIVGPGDDAAVIDVEAGPYVVTTDTLVEGIDFLPGDAAARLGRRAVSVALSDLAAMGAWPDFILLTLGLPSSTTHDFPLEVSLAAARRAEEFGAVLAGGDLSKATELFLTVAAWGRPAGAAILRSTARPGDVLFLSGWPGEAGAGLSVARARAGLDAGRGEGAWTPEMLPVAHETRLLAAYRDPEPRLALGRALSRDRLATAAIDVSDGLGVDASRLARASGVCVVIEGTEIPLSPALHSFCDLAGRDPLALALESGDDYELLFTMAPENAVRAADPPAEWGVEVRKVGRVEAGRGAFLEDENGRRPIGELGFDHLEGPR